MLAALLCNLNAQPQPIYGAGFVGEAKRLRRKRREEEIALAAFEQKPSFETVTDFDRVSRRRKRQEEEIAILMALM